jgi:energy-coupling factor transporter ATP-binding protein EcfA2
MDPIEMMSRFAPRDHVDPDALGYGFKIVMEPLPHRRFAEGMFRMAELHKRRQSHGVGGGLLLTGPSGAGKSTIIEAYEAVYPRVHEAVRTRIPVLRVKMPSSPTSRSLAGAILEELGRKNAHRGTGPEKTTWLHELFNRCGVEMLLLDEFQHIFHTQTLSAFRDVTDWLKNFMEATKVGMVACGLPSAEMVENSNEQLARRFSERIRITPFSFEKTEDFQEFRGILKAIGPLLPLPTETPLHEANLARRLHVGSYGLLDYVVKTLEGAVSAATSAGLETLDLPVLAAGFRNRVWQDVPERLNPFHPDSPLRPLDRPGEVFYLHTRQDPLGSPVAKRIGAGMAMGGR